MLFVMTMVMTLFTSIVVFSTPVLAVDAEWNGSSIVYDGNTYNKASTAAANDPRGFAQGTMIYEYIENQGQSNQTSHYITFAPDADLSQESEMAYSRFTNPPPGTQYTKVGDTDRISTAAAPDDVAQNQLSAGGTTSCDSRFTFGIGWIVCPVVNFLASAMDWLFEQLANFLVVRTMTASTDSPQYRIWEVMRNIANIAFLVAFLVMIYSQVSSLGISNYGIKRTLPRIIVAAIMVNLSYWICAIAVDISNILGYGFHDLFASIRDTVVKDGQNTWQVVSWQSIAGVILSGGAGAAALGIYANVVLAQTVGGSLFLLIPILLGVIIAVLVALLILTARQALIMIFILISPLAFVAYVLPSTEKWFDKWRSAFLTLLFLFPIFSVIFGGSQLAGVAIIQTAQDINTLILGMAVQVAPVVITPMLVRFSGSILGRLANLVNDPKRGMLDRTRNWSKERADMHRARVLAGANARTPFGRFTSNRTRQLDFKRRRREALKKVNEKLADEAFESSAEGRAIDLKMRVTLDKESLRKAKADAHFEELRAGRVTDGYYGDPRRAMDHGGYMNRGQHELMRSIDSMSGMADDIALAGMRKKQATEELQSQLNKSLLQNNRVVDGQHVLDYAAGIGSRDSVLAASVAQDRKEFGEMAAAQKELMSHFKVNAGEVEKLAMGYGDGIVTKTDGMGNVHRFHSNNEYTHDAAAEDIFSVGSHGQKMNVLMSTGAEFDANGNLIEGTQGTNYDYRRTIQQAAIKSGIGNIAPAVADKTLDDIINGKFKGEESWQFHSFRQILEGRVKTSTLSTANAESLKRLFNTVDHNSTTKAQFDKLIDQTVSAKIKTDNLTDDATTRGRLRAETIETFNRERKAMQKMAADVLNTPTVRQNTNAQSAAELNRFAKNG